MNSSSRVNPVFEECKKQRIGLMIFRIIYILAWIIAIVVLFDHVDSITGQMFGLVMGIFACLALLDVYAMQAIKQKENEVREQERNYMMRIVQDKKNKARREAQNIIVAEWEALCKAAGGLPTIESSFPCKRGEGVLHTESNVRLQETRKVRGPGGGTNDQWTTLDTGTFHVTNKRLVFLGNSGNRNIAINDIIAMKAFVDKFILFFVVSDHAISVFFGQKRQVFQSPLAILFVICFGVEHFHQMSYTPGDNIAVILDAVSA